MSHLSCEELLASKLRDGDALQQYEDDKRMVEARAI